MTQFVLNSPLPPHTHTHTIYPQQTCLPSSISVMGCDYPDPGQASAPSMGLSLLSASTPSPAVLGGPPRILQNDTEWRKLWLLSCCLQSWPTIFHNSRGHDSQSWEYNMNSALESLVTALLGIACGREGRAVCHLLGGRTHYPHREWWGGEWRQESPRGGRRFGLGPEECVGAHQLGLCYRFPFTRPFLTH